MSRWWAAAAIAVPGLACAITCVFLLGEAGMNAWLPLLLGAPAVAALALWRNWIGATACLAVFGLAMILLGHGLFSPSSPPEPSEAMVGIGIPSAARNFAWLAAGLAMLAALAALLIRRDGTRRVAGVTTVISVVLMGAAVPAGLALASATQQRLAERGIDRTVAADDLPATPDNGAPTGQHIRWSSPVHPDVLAGGSMALVPGRGLVVQTDESDASGMVRVFDAHTGIERWHYSVSSQATFVDARDGRLLVVSDPAAIVFDLATGRILGTARLPDPEHWLGPISDMHQPTIGIIGRTAVISYPDIEGLAAVFAVDLVDLHITELDRRPGQHCKYAVPEDSSDTFLLIRYHCSAAARLTVTGGRVAATVPLPISPTLDMVRAQATDRGAVLSLRNGPYSDGSVYNTVLAIVTGRPDPVLQLTSDKHSVDVPLVLPATANDPQRIAVAHWRFDKGGTDRKVTIRLIGTGGDALASPPGTPYLTDRASASGNRIFIGGIGKQVQVLDAHTLRQIRIVQMPREVVGVSTAGSLAAMLCWDDDGSNTIVTD